MNSKLIGYILTRCPENSSGQVQMDGEVVREILAALRAPAGVQAWVGLTDDEIEHLRNDQPWWVVRDIEAKLKEKNT
jgi:hypothetical protein